MKISVAVKLENLRKKLDKARTYKAQRALRDKIEDLIYRARKTTGAFSVDCTDTAGPEED